MARLTETSCNGNDSLMQLDAMNWSLRRRARTLTGTRAHEQGHSGERTLAHARLMIAAHKVHFDAIRVVVERPPYAYRVGVAWIEAKDG